MSAPQRCPASPWADELDFRDHGDDETLSDDLRVIYELHGCKIESGPKRCWKHRPGLTHQLDLGERGLAMQATSDRPAQGTRTNPFYDPLDTMLRNAARGIMQRASAAGRPYETITPAALAERFTQLGFECVWCGGPYECVDHVVATARGGADELSNLVPACNDCNSRKGDLEISRWLDGEVAGLLAPCGTVTAYRRHLRRHEKTCPPCRAAQREWLAARASHFRADS